MNRTAFQVVVDRLVPPSPLNDDEWYEAHDRVLDACSDKELDALRGGNLSSAELAELTKEIERRVAGAER